MRIQTKSELLSVRIGTLIGCLLLAAPAAGQSSLDRAIDSLFAVRDFAEVAISPDGRRVAWVESLHGKDGAPSANSSIQVAGVRSPGAPGTPPRRITAGSGAAHAEHSLAWSPEGSRLAFLSDAARPGQLELYVADATGEGSPRRVTDLAGYLTDPQWSPDAKTIGLLFIENAPRAAGPLEPMTPPSGEIDQHVYERRLALVETATGRVRQASPADLYLYEYDWSPDGARVVATAAHGAGDDNWWLAELEVIDVESGTAHSILKPPFQMAVPRWSPDGRSIAFIGGLMSDAGQNGGDVYVIPAGGGEARDVTPGMKASASWLAWSSPEEILFTENVDGMSGIATVAPSGSVVKTVWTGAEILDAGRVLPSLSLAADRKTSAVIRDSFAQPPEIWAGPIGQWKPVTSANHDLRPDWGEAQSIHWVSEGRQIQGWLLYPRDYNPNLLYPLVVLVHGGPASSAKPGWPRGFFNTSLLSTAGYFVLYPNPRGSFGQGEAFTQANVKDFGYGDLRDILAGVDAVVKILPIDPQRVGIAGWSYGGYISMWAVTQTNRFRAAVAGAGIADWLSYYGENDIDQWMIPYFGASIYQDPAVYARSSPINFIRNAKTPTLVLVGDRDGECPAPQSFEFWHGLKAQNVPTGLVVYPDEGHDIWQPAHRLDIIKRTVEWFNQYLRPSEAASR